MRMKTVFLGLLIFISSISLNCFFDGADEYFERINYYYNNSQHTVNIEIFGGRQQEKGAALITNLQQGDTAEIAVIVHGRSGSHPVANPLFDDPERDIYDHKVFHHTSFENLIARMTFIASDENKCLSFEGDPTTAEYPDIRLFSGYSLCTGDMMCDFIYTITDSLFEKATVCE